MFQIDTENDKNPKFSNFHCFHAFLVGVSTDFVDWNVFKRSTRNKVVVQ